MPVPARPRLRLPRRAVPYWAVALAVALATTLLLGRLAGDARAERARWGELQPTLVAIASVRGGEPIPADGVEVRLLPAAMVPSGALDELPRGAVAAADVHAGEPVLAARLVGPGSSAVSARLPRGQRGIALPAGSGLPLEVGDRVDVLATFDAAVAAEEPTFAVARDAVVVHVSEDAVTVAVDEGSAARVAYALAAGAVTPVLSGGSSRR